MGFADIVSRARAGSLLRSPTPLSPIQDSIDTRQLSEKPTLNEKQRGDTSNRSGHTGNTASHNRDPHLLVRTVPTWVHVLEDEEEDNAQATARLLPSSPPSAQVAQHHYTASDRPSSRPKPPRGRLHDHERDSAPPLPTEHPSQHTSRWRTFVDASAYPTITSEGGEKVTSEWLAQNGPDYSQPWMAGAGEGDAENGGFRSKRKVWWKRLQRYIIRSPMIPLVLRSVVWIFSAVALAVACSIHHLTDEKDDLGNIASTEMALIVDAVALVYLLYITYDEYSGKPLGLRSAKAKMRLILLDLFFIVFDSANLSLAFEAIQENSICPDGIRNDKQGQICDRQNTLASVLLIALVAWMLTFTISVLRLVERVTRK